MANPVIRWGSRMPEESYEYQNVITSRLGRRRGGGYYDPDNKSDGKQRNRLEEVEDEKELPPRNRLDEVDE